MNIDEKEKQPLVSVIMGIYNQYHQKQLICAINSIREQTFKDFELIIYDDGSDEEPARFLQQAAKADSRIRLIRKSVNQGLAFSLNYCIQEARGKYLARMDADDISAPTRFMEEFEFLESHPEYGWVGCNAYVFSKTSVWGKWVMAEVPDKYNYLPFSPYIHPSVMFRREILTDENKYKVSRDTLRCEDYELFMRLFEQGFRGYNLQKELFYYRQGINDYRKRTMKNRIREAKIRAMHFPHMGIPKLKCILYTLRPVVTGVIPYPLIAFYKRHRLEEYQGDDNGTEDIQKSLCAYIDYLYGMGFEPSKK